MSLSCLLRHTYLVDADQRDFSEIRPRQKYRARFLVTNLIASHYEKKGERSTTTTVAMKHNSGTDNAQQHGPRNGRLFGSGKGSASSFLGWVAFLLLLCIHVQEKFQKQVATNFFSSNTIVCNKNGEISLSSPSDDEDRHGVSMMTSTSMTMTTTSTHIRSAMTTSTTTASFAARPKDLKNITRKGGKDGKQLLDFAVAGFNKCGTTFLLSQVFGPSEHVFMGGDSEVHLLEHDKIEYIQKFVDLYKTEMKELEEGKQALVNTKKKHGHHIRVSSKSKHDKKKRRETGQVQASDVKNGFKSPRLLMSEAALTNLEKFFPKTNFIVSLRHPVLRFQSWYNFNTRVIYKKHGDSMSFPPVLQTVGICGEACDSDSLGIAPSFEARRAEWDRLREDVGGDHRSSDHDRAKCVHLNNTSGCTSDANYHHYLSRLGLTPMDTREELELLDYHGYTIHNLTKSKLFLVELGQMDGADLDITNQLMGDLEDYLGLHHKALPRVHETHENSRNIKSAADPILAQRMIDICDARYDDVRRELVEYGVKSSTWIEEYLLQSPKVVVSQREDFLQRIRSWRKDPCGDKESLH